MSNKRFNVDINSFNNTNDMDNIYAGNTPAQTIEDTPKVSTDKKVKTNNNNSGKINNHKQASIKDHTKTIDAEGRVNKKNNYALTFKIDADIDDYLKNILWINRKTKNQYVNDLIRADMLKTLKLKDTASYEELTKAWQEYKKANNI